MSFLKNILMPIGLGAIAILNTACSSDEEYFLNARVEDGLVILGSDPVIDQAYRTQKEVDFITKENIMKPVRATDSSNETASNKDSTDANGKFGSKNKAGYKLESPYADSGSGSGSSSSEGGILGSPTGDFSSSSTYKSKLKTNISQLNEKLLKDLSFDKNGNVNKTNISRKNLSLLMDFYAADMYKHASKKQLQSLSRYVVGAIQGKNEFQSGLANFYLDGFNNETYEQLAASWYLISASNNSTYSKYMLSILYQLGFGLPQDLSESVAWHKKAQSAKDNIDAQILVAKRYLNPTSAIHDPKQAFIWMESAAMQGNKLAQYLLADMYLQGRGVAVSEQEAINWYGKAAEQGSAYAQYSLGVMYYNGQGTEQNLLEANKWLEQAALQGFNEAQYLLGRMYEQGFGVERSLAKAHAWWQVIPKNNIVVDNFDQKISTLIAMMTPKQRLEADKLAKEYKKKIGVT